MAFVIDSWESPAFQLLPVCLNSHFIWINHELDCRLCGLDGCLQRTGSWVPPHLGVRPRPSCSGLTGCGQSLRRHSVDATALPCVVTAQGGHPVCSGETQRSLPLHGRGVRNALCVLACRVLSRLVSLPPGVALLGQGLNARPILAFVQLPSLRDG